MNASKRPSAEQLEVRTVGPNLKRPQRVDFGEAAGAERTLGEAEITDRVRRVDSQIIRCIDKSRDGYHWSGKVVVGFRIEADGRIGGMQVSAPALLLDNGLRACVKRFTSTLRFPSSSRATVAEFPYAFEM